MQDIVVYGTGGVGRQIVQLICDVNDADGKWRLLGYLDDDVAKIGRSIFGLPVLGDAEWLLEHHQVYVALAIGSPISRLRVRTRLDAYEHEAYATLLHPSVIMGSRTEIGTGSLLYAGSIVDPDVQLGDFTVINKLCSIGHDTRMADLVTMAPGVNVGGMVHVGSGCDLGIGSAMIQGVSVGDWSIIGAGAVVVSDLDPNVTAVGVPARVIKRRQSGWHLGG